jgi:microcystin-dependent protein
MGGYIGPTKNLEARVEDNRLYIATAGQVTFAAVYTLGYVDVFVNGVKLRPVTDFTATTGTTIDLVSAAAQDDEVEIRGRIVSSAYDFYLKSQVDAKIHPYAVAVGSGNAMSVNMVPVISALVDGGEYRIRVPSANSVTNPSVTFSNLGISKTITKLGNVPLQANDLTAGLEITVRYNSISDKLEVISLIGGGLPTGTMINFAGTSAPTGYLVCPTSATTVSRTTYAALFAAIGTTWGAGDGSSTFGLPWFPADYTDVQANGNVGTSSVGQNLSHTHDYTFYRSAGAATQNLPGKATDADTQSAISSSANGGAANLPAGVRVLKCIKF